MNEGGRVNERGRVTDLLSEVCRALAHPTRRALLHCLSAGECDVGNLCSRLGVDQPTVSKHLAVLRRAGLIQARVEGPRRCYTLSEPAVGSVLDQLEELERALTPRGE